MATDNDGELLRFRLWIERALNQANRDPSLIRLRPLLRRCLNITDDKLMERQHERTD